MISELMQGELRQTVDWGQEESRIRGLCYWYDQDKRLGFIRYLRSLVGPLSATDSTRDDSPIYGVCARQRAAARSRAAVTLAESASDPGYLGPLPTKPGELTTQDIAVVPKSQ